MSYFEKYNGITYTIDKIPKISDYNELAYIINRCLSSNDYKRLKGKNCGDKAKILLTSWGFIEPQYEIY